MKNLINSLLFIHCLTFAQDWKYLGLNKEDITALAIDWSNPNIIYAGSASDFSAGSVGGIFKSTNGGVLWDTLIRGVTVRDLDIHPKNSQILYATLGSNALTISGIIKTTDGGNNWARADSGIQMDWEVGPWVLAIDPKNPDTLYAGTGGFGSGGFYRSTDGGKSWKNSSPLITGYSAIAVQPDSSHVVYAGTDGAGDVFRSRDYGVTWSPALLDKAGIIFSIQFGINSTTIYVGSSYHTNTTSKVGIFKSTDDGATWTNPILGLPEPASISDIEVMNDNGIERVLIAAGWGAYQSIQGENWEKVGTDSFPVSSIVLFGRKLYAADQGVYIMDIPTSVIETLTSPANFELFNNFPNPFNPSTKITYQIGKQSIVSLEIYDIQGRKIKTLVHKEQSAGEYSIVWNGENENGITVSSGAYLYVLRVKGRVAWKKMIYLR